MVEQGLAPSETILTDVGKTVERDLLELSERFRYLMIEHYVIMPNHIHVILTLNAPAGTSPHPTIMEFVCAFKSVSTRDCKRLGVIHKLWQTSFYDHIIRNEDDYRNSWQDISNNPARWAEDQYHKT